MKGYFIAKNSFAAEETLKNCMNHFYEIGAECSQCPPLLPLKLWGWGGVYDFAKWAGMGDWYELKFQGVMFYIGVGSIFSQISHVIREKERKSYFSVFFVLSMFLKLS